MAERDRQFLAKLLATFRAEAREHVSAIEERLDELRRGRPGARAAAIEVAFREAHSLKAAARAVSRAEVERICQAMESAFSALKKGEMQETPALIDALQAANDALAACVAAESGEGTAPTPESIEALVAGLRGAGAPGPGTAAQAPPAAPAPEAPRVAADTVRLPVERLDALMLQVEDMLTLKLGAQAQAAALGTLLSGLPQWRAQCRRAGAALDWHESRLAALEAGLAAAAKSAAAQARETALRVDALLDDLKTVLMVEARLVLESLPRTARELAREQGKELDCVVEGADLEVDRRVLEEMREPLLHLVRNAVDHGVEKPAERVRAGKPARATLRIILIRLEGGRVQFSVSDDGAGVPLRRLSAAVAKSGLLEREQAASASAAQLLPLVFHSDVSTSSLITDVSGRGLGLAIVRERAERLGGRVEVSSEEGRGTIFRAVVPHALATLRGIPVRAAAHIVVLPTLGVERVLRLKRSEVRSVKNRPAVLVEDAHLPLIELARVLELAPPEQPAGEYIAAAVIGTGAQRLALQVDEVYGDQEVLVKPLGRCLQRVRNVAGATLLGDGSLAPILNVQDLIKSAMRASALAPRAAPEPVSPKKQPKVLVVEDSITARGLLRDILESAGYEVKTAVDGLEAWSALRLEAFDLVVSDVEMPRMNGFDLTARIRADRRLAELPVVLLTALTSREDRERGVEVGANAYLLKGEFEPDKLLQVMRRFA